MPMSGRAQWVPVCARAVDGLGGMDELRTGGLQCDDESSITWWACDVADSDGVAVGVQRTSAGGEVELAGAGTCCVRVGRLRRQLLWPEEGVGGLLRHER